MNQKDEALKMAILLLECPHITEGRINVIVDACKEALEQPTVAKLNDEYLRDTYVEGLNQPAQETVEWEDKEDEWSEVIAASHPLETKAFLEYETAMKMVGNRHSKGALVDLVCYLLQHFNDDTHPAQPLSDDEVNAILVKHGLDNVEMAGNHIDVVLLMRDVERAHGIGVKE